MLVSSNGLLVIMGQFQDPILIKKKLKTKSYFILKVMIVQVKLSWAR